MERKSRQSNYVSRSVNRVNNSNSQTNSGSAIRANRKNNRISNANNLKQTYSNIDEDISSVIDLFIHDLPNDFLSSILGLVSGMFRVLIKNPTIRIWRELKDGNRARPDLEGFEKIRAHRPNYTMFLLVGVLMLVGLVMMFALSPYRVKTLNIAYNASYNDQYFFTTQLVFVFIGLVCFFGVRIVPIKLIYKHSGTILKASFVPCFILLIAALLHIPIASCQLGACRWLNLGVKIQPAEILKFGILIWLSVFLSLKSMEGKVNNLKETLLPCLMVVSLATIIIAIFQKDLGTTISMLAIIFFQFIVAGLSRKNFTTLAIVALVASVLFIVSSPHRIARIATFTNENCANSKTEESKDDYHICQAKLAIGSGGLFGVGIGNSVQTTGYLPESVNDSVFAAMGEMFGFVGLLGVLGLFVALIIRILKISSHLENMASRIFVAGVCGWITVHTLINIYSMVGITPLTGITMPLISYGGTSMIMMSLALGMVFNISRYTSFKKVDNLKEGQNENSSSGRRLRRTRNTGSSRI